MLRVTNNTPTRPVSPDQRNLCSVASTYTSHPAGRINTRPSPRSKQEISQYLTCSRQSAKLGLLHAPHMHPSRPDLTRHHPLNGGERRCTHSVTLANVHQTLDDHHHLHLSLYERFFALTCNKAFATSKKKDHAAPHSVIPTVAPSFFEPSKRQSERKANITEFK